MDFSIITTAIDQWLRTLMPEQAVILTECVLTALCLVLAYVLFAIVNYARHHKIEPEVALEGTNNRFTSRFLYVEEKVHNSGKAWQDFTLDELDKFWDEAKKQEK
jgi:uncharacterized protein YabN with tetrapyrrole methylase and pyrophosphatase domain